MGDRPLSETLDRMIAGYFVSQAIYVAAELRIADRLTDGPRHAGELGAMSERTSARSTDCFAHWRASAFLPRMPTDVSRSRRSPT